MNWLTILLVGISANLDNLGIGISYGVRGKKVPLTSNVIIAVISGVVTFLSVACGTWLKLYMSETMANTIGGLFIIFLGLLTIAPIYLPMILEKIKLEWKLFKILKAPNLADTDKNEIISIKESILLGIALSLNCIGLGLGVGLSGISASFTAISVAIFAITTLEIGIRAGLKLSKSKYINKSSLISGIILILIGFVEIFM